MSSATTTTRKRQAERELAVTEVRAGAAGALVGLFLATILSVPLFEEWSRFRPLGAAEERASHPLTELAGAASRATKTATREGMIAADLELLAAIDRAESRLEDESFLRAWLLPRVQGVLLTTTGLGNEEVYPGREGWLFYRADLDHLTGRGFLEPGALRERARGGASWERPPQPDPLIALLDLHRGLAARAISLIVMPTPVKPSVHPERFAQGWAAPSRRWTAAVLNRSYAEFVARLESAGVKVFDPLPELLAGAADGEPMFLRGDTHWTPGGMERVAIALAEELSRSFELARVDALVLERVVAVENRGDLAAMLRLPEGAIGLPPQQVSIRTVTDGFGSNWRTSPSAQILLLGDSFTNVFSDPRLGWGASAGLAERLSFHLRRPIDRIAINAGGALASREALARDLTSGGGRLATKTVVIYQFATRELSFGDWRRVELE